VLERLVAEGAHLSCDAIAPGSWTLPSHASFFTGTELPVHGAHAVQSGEKLGLDTSETVRPLGPKLPTVAERFEGQTALVSANPVLGPASGLTRGFDVVRVPVHFGEWFGQGVVDEVRNVLRFEGDGRPLLLVVNIADAHQPWLEVPSSVDWAEPREAFRYQAAVEGDVWRTYISGTHPDPVAFQAQITDLYDFAVWRADDTLGRVLDVVEAYDREISRLLITSDHGELLGEDGLVDHGHVLNEGNQAVFVLDSHQPLPTGPLNALVVHDRVLAAANPHAQRAEWSGGLAFGVLTARSWSPPAVWTEGEPVPADEDFGGFVRGVIASSIATEPLDPELTEALKAAGYVD
jgi:arylsulfatase A-like enzyme